MKTKSVWRTALACLLGAVTAVAVYQHYWLKHISAQSATTTTMLLPWITGSDAGYTSLVSIENTSMSPFSATGTNGTCTASAYNNGALAGTGSLGTFNAGTTTTLTEAAIGSATGLSLANSGQRAYLYITCTFPDAQMQLLFVNPGGVVTFLPGQPVPSSQTNPQAGPAKRM